MTETFLKVVHNLLLAWIYSVNSFLTTYCVPSNVLDNDNDCSLDRMLFAL